MAVMIGHFAIRFFNFFVCSGVSLVDLCYRGRFGLELVYFRV